MDFSSRLEKLEEHLQSTRLDGIVIVNLPNIRYLCGFTGSSGVLAFARGEWSFFTDGRYTEQAHAQVHAAKVKIASRAALPRAAQWVANKFKRATGRSRIGLEAEHTTIAAEKLIESEFQRLLPKFRYRLVPVSGTVELLRIRKDPEELDQIRSAVGLASRIFPGVLKTIGSDSTEYEIAAELDHLARRAGAEKMSFETIVASGPRSARPHARPSSERIRRGFVVLDYGVILGGYCSDMTRTVCVGPADETQREIYSAVLEAQLAGIGAVRAGVEAQQVDRAARSLLRKRRLDKYFTHSLGHGVGIEIHEAPRLAKGQTQKLEAGMVITIEPGVYVPGKGGVRIEDMVLVTESGCEVLTPTPKELVIC